MKNILFILLFSISVNAANSLISNADFTNCPSKSTSNLAGEVIEKFQKTKSLRAVKQKVLTKKKLIKNYIKNYDVSFDPSLNSLSLSFECPKLVGKLIYFKNNGKKKYYMVLDDKGKTYDPNYEVLLRGEKKLVKKLPNISFEDNQSSIERLKKIADYLNYLNEIDGIDYNELILNKKDELVGILSRNNISTSVFLGRFNWDKKTVKLIKSLNYFLDKKKQPVLVKFVSDKKMVVKFSHPL